MRPAQVPRPGRGRAETRSQAHPRPRTQPPSRGAHLRPVHAVPQRMRAKLTLLPW